MKINMSLLLLALKLGGTLGKLAKSIKVLMFVGTAGVYSAVYGVAFAAMLIVFITIHEMGHLWAMRRSGMPIKGFYMIPFAGAMVIPERDFASRREEAFIAAMGPVAGLGITVVCAVAYAISGSEMFAFLALFNTIINVFNMLPVTPLDGGRMMKCIIFSATPGLRNLFAAFTVGAMALILVYFLMLLFGSENLWHAAIRSLNISIWALIFLSSITELREEMRGSQFDKPLMTNKETTYALLGYVGIIVGYVAAMSLTWGHPIVQQVVADIIHG